MMIKRLFELPMHSLPILQETPTYHDIVEILEDSVQSTKLQSKSQVTAMKKSTQEKKYSVKK